MTDQVGNIAIATLPGENTIYRQPTADEVVMLNVIQAPIAEVPSVNEQLFGLYSSLSSSSQILYAPYVATIKLFIDQGVLDLAKTIVSGVTVSAEDINTQQQMITLLGG